MTKRRIPSLNWLRVFEAAARTESFARAADLLNISAPAVSQQIRALESHFGTPLFTRSAHSVALTPAGRAFLPSVQHALVSVEATADGLFGRVRHETLYVQSVLIFAMGFLIPNLAAFQAAHPDIDLQMSTGNAHEDFARGFADMQIVFGDPSPLGRKGDRLLGESLHAVAHPDVAKMIETPEDLLAHTLIEVATHHAGWLGFLEMQELRSDRAKLFFVDSTPMAFSAAAHGAGVALARAPVSDLLQHTFGLKPCLPGIHMPGAEHYHLVHDGVAGLRPAAIRFRDWLLTTMPPEQPMSAVGSN